LDLHQRLAEAIRFAPLSDAGCWKTSTTRKHKKWALRLHVGRSGVFDARAAETPHGDVDPVSCWTRSRFVSRARASRAGRHRLILARISSRVSHDRSMLATS